LTYLPFKGLNHQTTFAQWGPRRAETRNGTVSTPASKSAIRFVSWAVLIVDSSDSGGPQT